MPFQRHQICPNWQSNIDMVNGNKMSEAEFLSDFSCYMKYEELNTK